MALTEKFSELESALSQGLAQLSDEFKREVSRQAKQLTESFNQTARRLRLAESPAEWRTTLSETASRFASIAFVFFPEDVTDAPAFRAAIESKETMVTLRDAAQLSEAILERLPEAASPRCFLFPVFDSKNQVQALLYAENPDRNALELLATVAGGTLPVAKQPEPKHEEPPKLIQLAPIQAAASPVAPPKPTPAAPQLDAVSLRARRFAQVSVARILLQHRDKLIVGRQNSSLYVSLKDEIDSARKDFQTEFLESGSNTADYFHEELIRTLARQDAALMGHEYPGPLR